MKQPLTAAEGYKYLLCEGLNVTTAVAGWAVSGSCNNWVIVASTPRSGCDVISWVSDLDRIGPPATFMTLEKRLLETDNQTSPCPFLFQIPIILYEEQIPRPKWTVCSRTKNKFCLRSKRWVLFIFANQIQMVIICEPRNYPLVLKKAYKLKFWNLKW